MTELQLINCLDWLAHLRSIGSYYNDIDSIRYTEKSMIIVSTKNRGDKVYEYKDRDIIPFSTINQKIEILNFNK